MRTVRCHAGYTLLELLVVISIIAVALGLLLAAVMRVRASAAKTQCQDKLHQISLALHQFHDVHKQLPPSTHDKAGEYPYLGWRAKILPFVEQNAIWEQIKLDFSRQPLFWEGPRHVSESMVVHVFVCPAEERVSALVLPENAQVAFSHYLGVAGIASPAENGCLFYRSRVRFADITDGLSSTLLVGERPPSPDNRFGWWYAGTGQMLDGSADMHLGVREYISTFRAPMCHRTDAGFRPGTPDDMCDAFHFWSRHPGGASFLFADGSVRFLNYSADPILPALATRAGGESVAIPD